MKRITSAIIAIAFSALSNSYAQEVPSTSSIDNLLINGNNEKVIDTCRQILSADSLNPEIWFKMGLAYQNLIADDKSFDCFSRSSELAPENKRYNFMFAKACINKGKNKQAKSLLEELSARDSMNWSYAYYLTNIYMQEGKYDDCIRIYTRFYDRDTTNYTILDKTGFAMLREGDFYSAIDVYNKSMVLNDKNTSAIKNLSYLYASTFRADTAIKLLTRATEIDPSDMDIYVRRAALYYATHNNKRALNDYLKVLASGDSTVLYLKRAGIGYTNNLQPKEAITYLLKAYQIDSSDYETSGYLARCYFDTKNAAKSVYFYKREIKILTPVNQQMGLATVMLAEALKTDGRYSEAIDTYLSATKMTPDINLYMNIGNLYDEKLGDMPNAIKYYELFLKNIRNASKNFETEYVGKVEKRVEYLKEKLKPALKGKKITIN